MRKDGDKSGVIHNLMTSVTTAWKDARKFFREELWDMDL